MHPYQVHTELKNRCTHVCIQVYYHLGAFEDSVTYALGADKLFNVNASTEYVETIVGTVDVIFIFVCCKRVVSNF